MTRQWLFERAYEVENNLAVRMGLELRALWQMLAQREVVVDFAVNGKDDFAVLTCQRLCTRI